MTYYPRSPFYTLLEGDNSSLVQVQLVDAGISDYTTLKIVPRFQEDNATIMSVVVRVGIKVEGALFHEAIMHELGHALGLGHVKCCSQEDLMNANVNQYAARQYSPSTLDLYALHVLATAKTIPSTVTLPAEIQYLTVPEQVFFGISTNLFVDAVCGGSGLLESQVAFASQVILVDD